MKKISIFFIMLSFITSCGNKSQGQNTENIKYVTGNMFFENSKRSTVSLLDEMADGIAKLNGCTGFFLKNDTNKNYIATARHCFAYKANDWCSNGGSVLDFSSNKTLKCLNVAVGDSLHDLIILEFESSNRNISGDFQLADFEIHQDIKLSMLGFPADPYNSELALKLTEHCWVQNTSSTSVYSIPETINDKVFRHNCSTYGGNSGGPIFIEGTRVAIGLPDEYHRSNFENNLSNDSAQGVLISGFVNDFRKSINDLKISLASEISYNNDDNYLSEGSFLSNTVSGCAFKITKVLYNTNTYPTTFT